MPAIHLLNQVELAALVLPSFLAAHVFYSIATLAAMGFLAWRLGWRYGGTLSSAMLALFVCETSFAERGTDPAIEEYIGAQIWGTPEQCIEKVVAMQGHVGADTLTLNFRYGSIPIEEALEGMTLFAREAMPTAVMVTPS